MLLERGRVTLDGEALELPAGHLAVVPKPARVVLIAISHFVPGVLKQTRLLFQQQYSNFKYVFPPLKIHVNSDTRLFLDKYLTRFFFYLNIVFEIFDECIDFL